MGVPAELRRRPPEPTLRWVAAQFGPDATVGRVRRLRNSWAAAVHAVDVAANGERHQLVLRRWARPELPPDPGAVENEARALEAIAETAIPAPELVASDADAAHADVPAVLMTRLPGRDVLAPDDVPRWLDGLATTLRTIHAANPPRLGAYAPWNLEVQGTPPTWTRTPEVWERAIEIANAPTPAFEPRLCHRDYHPGNVLWQRGRISGVVDWPNACLGPVAVDLAHCRLNLALLLGIEVADAFARAYGRVDDVAYFDLRDAVGATGIVDELWRFHDAGRTDLTTDLVIDRVDAFVALAVKRCG
jgi:aminoglycoside phosphotransferase (APT) family kinase protein